MTQLPRSLRSTDRPLHSAGVLRQQCGKELVRGDGRAADVVAFEEGLVGFFVEAAELLGAPKSVAAIYGICFASEQPLCFAEIQARLNISAGSLSQGLRVLRDVGALKVVEMRHDRREFFEPDLQLRKLVAHYFGSRLETHLDAGRERLKRIGKALPGGSAKAPKILRVRLQTLESWQDKSRALLPVVKAILRLA